MQAAAQVLLLELPLLYAAAVLQCCFCAAAWLLSYCCAHIARSFHLAVAWHAVQACVHTVVFAAQLLALLHVMSALWAATLVKDVSSLHSHSLAF